MSSNDIVVYSELVKIIHNHYVDNELFRSELLKALYEKTGNNNLGLLCEHVIDTLSKNKNCDLIVTLF